MLKIDNIEIDVYQQEFFVGESDESDEYLIDLFYKTFLYAFFFDKDKQIIKEKHATKVVFENLVKQYGIDEVLENMNHYFDYDLKIHNGIAPSTKYYHINLNENLLKK